ncbi:MAG: zf-HC2 domain-containing protein [Gemmatimonadaceae bacterium]|jgi:anti-sigma factor RsiW|nr:zf-HC2 domain-containing protein [Gemmatimonadaceae bacterium]
MADLDRVVAGIACRDVLADLSDFLDGALTATRVAELQAHLDGCDTCARFGADVAATMQALRAHRVTREAAVPPVTAARLRDRLARAYLAIE